ncbi:MAG: hypothetical protein IPP35_07685 [Elusimicrobia bacterium]|nr:hypothetical protein [Elusimicrobiota bacterium]
MKRWSLAFGLVFAAMPSRGEEGVRLPSLSSGTVKMGKDSTTIRYPFGEVVVPLESVRETSAEKTEIGKLHARTLGTFRLSYQLGKEGDLFVARQVRVWVENREEYLSPATPKLREHEAMHRRINEAEARRMEAALASFQTKASNATIAERRFKTEFQTQVAAAKKLHADWDENHVFIRPSTDTVKVETIYFNP